ncbi:hypothetical protein BFGS084_00591 [Bacteroides fragilis]|nr:hypothetical protein BFGS084_00591 [Bacteroides fragilis]
MVTMAEKMVASLEELRKLQEEKLLWHPARNDRDREDTFTPTVR